MLSDIYLLMGPTGKHQDRLELMQSEWI